MGKDVLQAISKLQDQSNSSSHLLTERSFSKTSYKTNGNQNCFGKLNVFSFSPESCRHCLVCTEHGNLWPALWVEGSPDKDGKHFQILTSFSPLLWEFLLVSDWSCNPDEDSWGSFCESVGSACCNLGDKPEAQPPPSQEWWFERTWWLWKIGTSI